MKPKHSQGTAGDGRWTRAYLDRRGTGATAFRDRLARARLLYLRRRELISNWLALALVVGCWDVAGRLDQVENRAPATLDAGLAALTAADQDVIGVDSVRLRSDRLLVQ